MGAVHVVTRAIKQRARVGGLLDAVSCAVKLPEVRRTRSIRVTIVGRPLAGTASLTAPVLLHAVF